MGNNSNASWDYQVELRGERFTCSSRGAGDPRPLSPLWGVFQWSGPYAWQMRVPNLTVRPGDFQPCVLVLTPPVSKVSLWIFDVVPQDPPGGLPTLDVQLRKGAGVAGADAVVVQLGKGLATLVADPLLFQVSGETAEEWAIWARISGGAARDMSIGFAMLASQSKCCDRQVIG